MVAKNKKKKKKKETFFLKCFEINKPAIQRLIYRKYYHILSNPSLHPSIHPIFHPLPTIHPIYPTILSFLLQNYNRRWDNWLINCKWFVVLKCHDGISVAKYSCYCKMRSPFVVFGFVLVFIHLEMHSFIQRMAIIYTSSFNACYLLHCSAFICI